MYVYNSKYTVLENFCMERTDEGIVIEFDENEMKESDKYHRGNRDGEFLVEAKKLLEMFCDVYGIPMRSPAKNKYVKFSLGEDLYTFNAIENYEEIKRKYELLFVVCVGIDQRISKNKVIISEPVFREFIRVVNAHSDDEKKS